MQLHLKSRACCLALGAALTVVLVLTANAVAQPPRQSRLSLGGHFGASGLEVCGRDQDVIGCVNPPWAALGLDIEGFWFLDSYRALGGRFALTKGVGDAVLVTGTGAPQPGTARVPERDQWLVRLLFEGRLDQGRWDGGFGATAGLGAHLLTDTVDDGSAQQPDTVTLLGPAVSLAGGYDLAVFEHLLVGFGLRAELAYLVELGGENDLGVSLQRVSTGLVPQLELTVQVTMSN